MAAAIHLPQHRVFQEIHRVEDLQRFQGRIVIVEDNRYFANDPSRRDGPEYRIDGIPYGVLFVSTVYTERYQGGRGIACSHLTKERRYGLPTIVNAETLEEYPTLCVREASKDELAKIKAVVQGRFARFPTSFCPEARSIVPLILAQA